MTRNDHFEVRAKVSRAAWTAGYTTLAEMARACGAMLPEDSLTPEGRDTATQHDQR